MSYTPSIVVDPPTMTLYVGQTAGDSLTATTCPSGISYTWFSMDPQIATVSSTGIVTAVSPGTAYIVANGGSNGSGTCVVTVLDFSIEPTELNFVVWEDFGLIYKNGVRSQLNYNQSQHTFYTDCICDWSVGNESIIRLDYNSLYDCELYIDSNGIEGTTTLSCTISETSTTRTCTINVIRIKSSDIHVRFLNGTNAEINNDEMPNSYNLNAQIYATKNGVTYHLDTDEYITYSVQQCYDKYGVFSNELQNHVSVNSTTGVVSVQQATTFNAAHPTGTAQIRAKCTINSSKFAEKAVTVKCSDHPFVSPGDNTADHVHGRYIRIPHSDQSVYHNYSDFEVLMIYYYGNSAEKENISGANDNMNEFESSDGWIQYTDYNLQNNVRSRKLLHLIASSKYCTLWSHGNADAIECHSRDTNGHVYSDILLTKDMIRSVHDGFFNYTELLFLTTCLSGYTNGATDPSIMQLFADKGVKVVVGFENSPLSENCSTIEYLFYQGLSVANSSAEDVYEDLMENVGNNVTDGFIILSNDTE
ncbi:MAG: Ig-like domain-containing protein [Clostridia bacterium]|nr:Ig-like domain-containing protein [Clostridia bacterium]